MSEVEEILLRERVLTILRYPTGGDIRGALDALAAGGLTMAEVTSNTPGALAAIEAAASEGRTVGYGTVLTTDHVREAADAGAKFTVSPAMIPSVIVLARELGLEPIVGVYTATEVLAAIDGGARLLKLFPATQRYDVVSALLGPFPQARLIPTGGVAVKDVVPFLRAGATAVAVGSDLAGRTAPADERARAEMTARAARAVAGVAEFANGGVQAALPGLTAEQA